MSKPKFDRAELDSNISQTERRPCKRKHDPSEVVRMGCAECELDRSNAALKRLLAVLDAAVVKAYSATGQCFFCGGWKSHHVDPNCPVAACIEAGLGKT